MKPEEYIEQRLLDQIKWYSAKSQFNQRWFKRLRILEIVSAAVIPFLAGLGPVVPYYQFVVGALGAVIAISAGISAIYKFHENWIEYRTTAETLKHELYLYETRCSPYDNEEAFCRLVERVEGLISKENTRWSRYTEQTKGA